MSEAVEREWVEEKATTMVARLLERSIRMDPEPYDGKGSTWQVGGVVKSGLHVRVRVYKDEDSRGGYDWNAEIVVADAVRRAQDRTGDLILIGYRSETKSGQDAVRSALFSRWEKSSILAELALGFKIQEVATLGTTTIQVAAADLLVVGVIQLLATRR